MPDRAVRGLRWLAPYALVALFAGSAAIVIDLLVHGKKVTFASGLALLLLASCVLVAWVSFHLHVRRAPTFAFSRVSDLAQSRRGILSWLSPAPRALRLVAVGLIAFALARPQSIKREIIEVEGIDIMFVLDISKSMEERDLDPYARINRLEAAQKTMHDFLQRMTRDGKRDRVGLVVFAREAMLQCPLTLDYGVLDTIVTDMAIGDLDPQGTAIGDGLGLALASLRRSDPRAAKVIVLLTDGDANVETEMSPDGARDLAKKKKIKVFTVLMGRELGDDEPVPPPDVFGRQPYPVNPKLLKDIAKQTGGRYYHAGSSRALQDGFAQVRETLDKSKKQEARKIPTELYPQFVVPALGLLLFEILLSLTRWRRFP